ncbi:MAG: hypothetical protein JRJ35_17890 [Deltaproteobacteria bacterium]|nr:hypothetical protein [Deltaproteobacteria bacterium]MBW1935890.1 hypothetical protein [Deltaproteobacteria bacterium]RLB39770.1 MAG: hypothetical protein DRH20_02860 [Deltaproteobacteria bacterium]
MNHFKKYEKSGNEISSIGEQANRVYLRRRLRSIGFSMIAMGICFPLYYLGLFGGVKGPLNPEQLGTSLANMGLSKVHMLVFFISLLIFATAWNWVYNLVSLLMGARFTCAKKMDKTGEPCGVPVTRKRFVSKRTGLPVTEYVCEKGHRRSEAHFHPVKKGAVSHSLWVISLAFCAIVLFLS